MQIYIDTATNNVWAFEDDVEDIFAFASTPKTLVSYVRPAPTTAQLLTAAKSAQIATLAAAYNAAIQQPVSYMSTTFQADSASQQTLTRCLVAGSVPAGFYWLDANNAQVPMTFAQLQGLASAMLVQGQAAFTRLQTRKASVNGATTVSAVQAVVW